MLTYFSRLLWILCLPALFLEFFNLDRQDYIFRKIYNYYQIFFGDLMDNKKILLVFVAIIVIGLVAAAAMTMNNANSVKVGDKDFKLPEGYTVNETDAHNTSSSVYGDFPVNVNETVFTNGTDSVYIGVMDCGSPDNAKKAYDSDTEDAKTTKTINGHEGAYAEQNNGYAFQYCNDKYNIRILATNETLLEGAVS